MSSLALSAITSQKRPHDATAKPCNAFRWSTASQCVSGNAKLGNATKPTTTAAIAAALRDKGRRRARADSSARL
jgi:hypothetical protein